MLFVGHPGCSTCKKARDFLDAKGIVYEWRDIRSSNPSREELKEWHARSKLPLKRFFNTSGQLYREQQLSTKLPLLTENEQYDVLASDGMLVKRPVLIGPDFVLLGFRPDEWEEQLAKNG